MTNDQQFDQLLDHALGEYRDMEPLSGLEGRVLQRLQSHTAERRSPWRAWGTIATCAVVMLIAAGIEIGRRSHTALSTHPKQAGEQVSPPAATRSNASWPSQEISAQAVARHPSVKSADRNNAFALRARAGTPTPTATATSQFPTPVPLTAEEHALLAMLHANPGALPKREDNSDDSTIAPLEIKPLTGSAVSTRENSNE